MDLPSWRHYGYDVQLKQGTTRLARSLGPDFLDESFIGTLTTQVDTQYDEGSVDLGVRLICGLMNLESMTWSSLRNSRAANFRSPLCPMASSDGVGAP